jgi:hypothetical protein
VKTEASGGEREKQEEINTRATKTPLTRRATASRPRWGFAKPERPRCGRSRCAGALVRQAKLGASCGVQVPAEQGLTNHSYQVLQLWRKQRCRAERNS